MAIDKIIPPDNTHAYVGGDGGQKRRKPSGHSGGYGAYEKAMGSSVSSVEDETSFFDIPQNELTSAVTLALEKLVGEIEGLQDELHRAQSLEKYLSDGADHHMDLPVLTRHALLREVQAAASHAQRTNTTATFAYIQIANFFEIKQTYGLLAGEDVLRECAELIKPQLRKTDRIGTLGGDGFGILLPLSSLDAARNKLDQLVKLIERGPYVFEGQLLGVTVKYGVHSLHLSEDIKTIVRLTDGDLRKV